MRPRLLLLGFCVFAVSGCQKHPLTDYRPIDKAGMWSGSIEQLKKLNPTDAEVTELVKLKNSGASDEACLALIDIAHQHLHPFTSASSAISLAGAHFTEQQILDLARAEKLETLTNEAVTLRLIGLSDSTVQTLMQRHLQDMPTLSSGEISRLKNTGLTEKQILERINQGMTDEQADHEIASREAVRNHSNTGFVRIHGRKPR